MQPVYKNVGECIETQRKDFKIKTNQYLPTGEIPVIDQGADFIAGYINDPAKAYAGPLPVIVFGDHTCCLKYVSVRFAVGADGTQLITPNSDFNVRYFYYALRAQKMEHFGYQRHFKLLKAKDISWFSPPMQRKIVSILSAYDDLIENNLRRIKILEEMAQTLYREWFVKFRFPGHEKVRMVDSPLGKIPEGWEAVPFTDIADVLSGGTPKTKIEEYWGGSIPFFAPKDAPDSFYVTNTEKSITEIGLTKCNSRLYQKDTVFITARGTVGKVVMPSMGMAMNQSCYALRGKDGISQQFIFLATKQQVDYLKKNTGGATFDTIVVDTFKRMVVVRPSAVLIDHFSRVVRPLMELVLNTVNKNTNLRQTRDHLLPRLISGGLDVSELDIDTSALNDQASTPPSSTESVETLPRHTKPQAKGADRHQDNKENPKKESQTIPIDQWETNDVMAVFRTVGRGRGFIERKEFIRLTARAIGYRRLEPRIDSVLKGHLRAALRRRVLESDSGYLRIATPSVSEYDPDELIKTLRSVIRKSRIVKREAAIREVALHLGFQRIREQIRNAIRNAIGVAIRRGIFKGDRESVWRMN